MCYVLVENGKRRSDRQIVDLEWHGVVYINANVPRVSIDGGNRQTNYDKQNK